MKISRSLWFIIGFMAVSLFLRIVLPYGEIFTEKWVKFSGPDSYWQMYLVDHMVPNFTASNVLYANFFVWLLSAVIWIAGLGHPTQQVVNTVAAYFPAVMGALTVIPVYFLGKALFGRLGGIVAAGLIAILPGEWLGRSLLGAVDYHVAEVLFSTTSVMFLVMALKSEKNWIVLAFWSSFFLALYLLTWPGGGLLFVFILVAFLVAQSIVSYSKGEGPMTVIGTLLFTLPLLVFTPRSASPVFVGLAVAVVIPFWLVLMSAICRGRNWPYALTIGLMGFCSLPVFYLLFPEQAKEVLHISLAGLNRFGDTLTTQELRPLFFPAGKFDFTVAWRNWTTLLVTVPIGLYLLVKVLRQKWEPELALFLTWSAVMLIVMLAYRRFAYYFAVNASLLTGFAVAYIWQRLNIRRPTWQLLAVSLAVLVLVVPNVYQSVLTTQRTLYTPSEDWMETLEWTRNNTPEKSAILTWWDYGHWVIRETGRQPTSGGGADAETARALMGDTAAIERLGADYIILDYPTVTSKFWAIAMWAGGKPENYSSIYYVNYKGEVTPTLLFYPAYYQSLAVRLYNFNGQAVESEKTVVIHGKGNFITAAKVFTDYAEALSYVFTDGGWIVGTSPLVSPIPLEAVAGYELVYTSPQREVKVFRKSAGGQSEQ